MKKRAFVIKRHVSQIVVYCALLAFLVMALFPVYWMFNTSFKTNGEIYRQIPTFWPASFSTSAYRRLIAETGFVRNVGNSLIICLSVTLASTFFSVLAAYAIARMRFRGRAFVSKLIFYAYLIPRTVMYIPLYMLNVKLGLVNTLMSLMAIYPTIVVPYATWMMISYFKTIPFELEESASIDGAGRMRSIFSIILPIAMPGVVSTAILSFTLCWSEYLYALVNITKDKFKTVPVGLSNLILDDLYAWGMLAAGAVFASLPIVILYVISNRQVENGLMAGAIKG